MDWDEVSVVRWKEGSATTYSPKGLIPPGLVSGLSMDDNGSLLVGWYKRGLGMQRLTDGKWAAVTAPGFDGSKLQVSALLMDRNRALWIGTQDEGVYRLYHGQIDHFGRIDGLSGDRILRLFEDQEGTLWVATDRGLDNFHDLPVLSISNVDTLKVPEFDNLVTLPDGNLWIGGDGFLLTLKTGTLSFTPRGGNLKGKQVTTIFQDHTGRIWIGLDNTLNIFRDGKFVPIRCQMGTLLE